jgi:hypothetical protein
MKHSLDAKKAPTDDGARHGPIIDALERVLADIPSATTRPSELPDAAAKAIARRAAKRAAMLSGSLALPPGPLGFMTLLPDIYLIWQTQRQMVAEIFGVYGRSAELTRTHHSLMRPDEASGLLFHELVGQWLAIEQDESIKFDAAQLAEATVAQFEKHEQDLQDVLERSVAVAYASNPWRKAAGAFTCKACTARPLPHSISRFYRLSHKQVNFF